MRCHLYKIYCLAALRSRVVVAPDVSEADLRTLALADPKVQSFIDGHQVVKVIVVPQRLVNVVVK